jgi:hypothetical protein
MKWARKRRLYGRRTKNMAGVENRVNIAPTFSTRPAWKKYSVKKFTPNDILPMDRDLLLTLFNSTCLSPHLHVCLNSSSSTSRSKGESINEKIRNLSDRRPHPPCSADRSQTPRQGQDHHRISRSQMQKTLHSWAGRQYDHQPG